MKKEEVLIILKGLIGKDKSIKLHISLNNTKFYNGVLLSIDKEEECLSFTDMKYGFSIIPFSQILSINLYREKE